MINTTFRLVVTQRRMKEDLIRVGYIRALKMLVKFHLSWVVRMEMFTNYCYINYINSMKGLFHNFKKLLMGLVKSCFRGNLEVMQWNQGFQKFSAITKNMRSNLLPKIQ